MTQNRRDFLKTAALGGLVAGTGSFAFSGIAEGAIKGKKAPHDMRSDGTYSTVELAKPNVTLGVVQTPVRALRVSQWKKDLKANLDEMLRAIDKAFHFGAGPDILFFHEFPITGWDTWARKEIVKFALEIPGPESELIAAKAKQHNCMIVFGSYVNDPDWPNHILSVTTMIGPDGEIVDKHWKARNIKGVFPGFELFTTTIYDVLDEYVEMYGEDAVLPVTRTAFGNIATSSIQREPELFRAMAMKGAEIFLRTATGGFTPLDMQATSLYNGVYTAICNNAVSPDNPNFFDDAGSGGTAVYGPRGEVVAEADTKFETLVRARIPIASFRQRNRQPIVHMELYREVFNQYGNPYGPNLFSGYLPSDLQDAKRYLADKSKWK